MLQRHCPTFVRLKGHDKLVRIVDDVDADHEMRGMHALFLQELVQLRGVLCHW